MTVKSSWLRITVDGLVTTLDTDGNHSINIFKPLLISQFRVCRQETYRVKLLTYRVLLRYSEESGRAAQPPAAASAQGAQAGAVTQEESSGRRIWSTVQVCFDRCYVCKFDS